MHNQTDQKSRGMKEVKRQSELYLASCSARAYICTMGLQHAKCHFDLWHRKAARAG